MNDTAHLLKEGLSDALGFVGGALAAYWIARWLGFDIFAEGYNGSSIGGIVAVGLGGGLGLQVARRWRASNADKD